ncbi:hypothetical protein ACWDUA_19005, partial [Gordonia sp. NPDC003376]
TVKVVGTTIGTGAAIFALVIAATFGISRIVEPGSDSEPGRNHSPGDGLGAATSTDSLDG